MTSIEWTDRTWNPMRGCRRVSPGCENCYAERQAIRQAGAGKMIGNGVVPLRQKPPGKYHGLVRSGEHGPRWTGDGAFDPVKLQEPLSWKSSSDIFVDSMSDLFYERFSFEEIAAVFGVMALTPWHRYQILTKRPERALQFFAWLASAAIAEKSDPYTVCLQRAARHVDSAVWGKALEYAGLERTLPECEPWPLPHVWIGVSVESQKYADERIPLLLQIPAAVHFLSMEPLLEAVLLHDEWLDGSLGTKINWVIVGGESGGRKRARRCHVEWIDQIVAKCFQHKIAVFVKQLGSNAYEYVVTTVGQDACGNIDDDGRWEKLALKHPKGGNVEEWPERLRVRQMPDRRAA
jgi:protein gp37